MSEAVPKPVVAAVAGVNGTTCSLYPACVAAGIVEGDCCPNADQVVSSAAEEHLSIKKNIWK